MRHTFGYLQGCFQSDGLMVGRLLSVSSTILCGVAGWNKKGERERDQREQARWLRGCLPDIRNSVPEPVWWKKRIDPNKLSSYKWCIVEKWEVREGRTQPEMLIPV